MIIGEYSPRRSRGEYFPKITEPDFDFFEYIFTLHLLNGEKGCLPYFSEQESSTNAGKFLFQVCFTQHILCTLRTILIQIRQHASMFVLFDNKVFLDHTNR